ncbi:UvrD-helicase domain-containing protein [Agrobacterium fabrum]|uniref:UvrD-helicase domain-containing protein n=1 Tax=Agrobacterium fabrum TaxID=1176649 RepID=UPI000EF500FB|nr:UvrD-helicase domain-containing protein [Agrobacterium fabrum]AYM60604.1 hypothetical protein At1D132_45970 [Agrobacterium fabrum]NSZ14926.1 UvrD-helicase domain-containing protein [Agrobacterium fabrum]
MLIGDEDIEELLGELNSKVSDPTQHIVFDAARRHAFKSYEPVQACPGSGKTTLVALKLIALAKKWTDQRRGICVLTHTNVAKDEILKRLRDHPAGYRLSRYPHFIGTIQEFVDTFLAFPYARARGWEVRLLPENAYGETVAKERWKKAKDLGNSKLYYLSYYMNRGKISPEKLALVHTAEGLSVSPEFLSDVSKVADLTGSNIDEGYFWEKREALCRKGAFMYREMYELALQLIAECPAVLGALRVRFPIVFVDEMQDTQKFQDELINVVFPSPGSLVQKVGDPDQAIFDGFGGGGTNETYNSAALSSIAQSHRFTPQTAAQISGLSSRGLVLGTSRSPVSGPPNTILVYDDSSIGGILEAFAEIVAALPADRRQSVKAVGGVGTDPGLNGLTIRSYWSPFDRATAPRTFRPSGLCQAVRYCCELGTGDIYERHALLMGAIVELLRRAGSAWPGNAGRTRPPTGSALTSELKRSGMMAAFRQWLAEIMMRPIGSSAQWEQRCAELRAIFGLGSLSAEAESFLAFNAAPMPTVSPNASDNRYIAANGVVIDVATIHAIKGETHDATLVLETRYRTLNDVSEMLPYLTGSAIPKPIFNAASPNSQISIRASFMKRLYVAASRPRHLLCVAVHKDRLSAEHRAALVALQWAVSEPPVK